MWYDSWFRDLTVYFRGFRNGNSQNFAYGCHYYKSDKLHKLKWKFSRGFDARNSKIKPLESLQTYGTAKMWTPRGLFELGI